MTLTRRDALRLAAAAAAAPLVPKAVAARSAEARAIAAGRFFSASEMAVLDELTELIIPADEHSGGARAAEVAACIDGRLAEFDPGIPELREAREKWKAGLAGFLALAGDERLALLERLAAQEKDPETEAERFFAELKSWTAHAYYTSRIGIHDELEYKGSTLLEEFVGTDPATLPRKLPGA
ncbi:MAG TPA: gluconate 2-dehydrogenase subunit 3 family protein [Vicinamibacteria bacterium]|nr:gluconate 2-dehydrogenase subunit 3 family protein [Vicinamibacteria bacterium]